MTVGKVGDINDDLYEVKNKMKHYRVYIPCKDD